MRTECRSAILGCWIFVLAAAPLVGQERRIIDVHVHAQDLWVEPGSPEPLTGLRAASSTEALRLETFRVLEEVGVVLAIVSGPRAAEYKAANPDATLISPPYEWLHSTPVDSLRRWFEQDRAQVLAEFAPQYDGLPPNAPELEPYFALAEELDIPVGLHMGLGPPGAAYVGMPDYRMTHGNPLLLEEVLVAHPDLRLYVMHAGWPFLEEMIGLLYAHPQVYVDIGVIDWVLPKPEFHHYLKRIVEAGFGDRVMFGSDQMVWPEAIRRAVDAVETADFLTEAQKDDIFYNNAARFLRLDTADYGTDGA